MGELDEAEALAREAWDTRRAVQGPQDVATAERPWRPGDRAPGREPRQLQRPGLLFEQALSIREDAVRGPTIPRIGPCSVPLSSLLADLGRNRRRARTLARRGRLRSVAGV